MNDQPTLKYTKLDKLVIAVMVMIVIVCGGIFAVQAMFGSNTDSSDFIIKILASILFISLPVLLIVMFAAAMARKRQGRAIVDTGLKLDRIVAILWLVVISSISVCCVLLMVNATPVALAIASVVFLMMVVLFVCMIISSLIHLVRRQPAIATFQILAIFVVIASFYSGMLWIRNSLSLLSPI